MDKAVSRGLSRRVLVLRYPDVKYFDEAIFILRKDGRENDGVTPESFMLEAERAARRFGDQTETRGGAKWVALAAWASGIAGFAAGIAAGILLI